MSWFFYILPICILYVATAFFNQWPAESLWVLAIMIAGPIWMMVKELMPKVLQNINTKYNVIHFLQRNAKKKDSEIRILKSEIAELNEELRGLYKIWQDSKSKLDSKPNLQAKSEPQSQPAIQFKHATAPVPAEVVQAKTVEKFTEELPYATSMKIFTDHKMKNYSMIENEAYDIIEMTETTEKSI